MKILLSTFFLWLFFPVKNENLHPIYTAITQLEYNANTRETELSIKVFYDDMEKALREQHTNIKDFGLNTTKENPQTDAFINDYLQKSIAIKINNKPCKLHFIGKEYDKGDILWCYFTIDNKKAFKTVEMTNSIFTEMYPKQTNIIQIIQSKQRKNLLINKDNPKGSVNF